MKPDESERFSGYVDRIVGSEQATLYEVEYKLTHDDIIRLHKILDSKLLQIDQEKWRAKNTRGKPSW